MSDSSDAKAPIRFCDWTFDYDRCELRHSSGTTHEMFGMPRDLLWVLLKGRGEVTYQHLNEHVWEAGGSSAADDRDVRRRIQKMVGRLRKLFAHSDVTIKRVPAGAESLGGYLVECGGRALREHAPQPLATREEASPASTESTPARLAASPMVGPEIAHPLLLGEEQVRVASQRLLDEFIKRAGPLMEANQNFASQLSGLNARQLSLSSVERLFQRAVALGSADIDDEDRERFQTLGRMMSRLKRKLDAAFIAKTADWVNVEGRLLRPLYTSGDFDRLLLTTDRLSEYYEQREETSPEYLQALFARARTLIVLGDDDRAKKAIAKIRACGSAEFSADLLFLEGELYSMASNRFDIRAHRKFRQATELFRKGNTAKRREFGTKLHLAAQMILGNARNPEPLELLREAHRWFSDNGPDRNVGFAMMLMSRVHHKNGDLGLAHDFLWGARALVKGDPRTQADLEGMHAETYFAERAYKEAADAAMKAQNGFASLRMNPSANRAASIIDQCFERAPRKAAGRRPSGPHPAHPRRKT